MQTEIGTKLGDNYTGFTYTMKSMTLKTGDDTKADVVVTISKTGDTEKDVTITIGAVAVNAGATALVEKIEALTLSVGPTDITSAGANNVAKAEAAITAAVAADSSINATGYTIAVTGVTGITDATASDNGTATAAFSVTNDTTAANTATGSVTITINKE